MRHERPDLEEQREELVKDMADSSMLLKQLEDTLLKELSSAEGNILDNEELIKALRTPRPRRRTSPRTSEGPSCCKGDQSTRVKWLSCERVPSSSSSCLRCP